eukprot:m.83785 g.83785  ORF g.83785 m.83785 type:complete len:93 (-) comp9560_c0_seq2:99-377(-)
MSTNCCISLLMLVSGPERSSSSTGTLSVRTTGSSRSCAGGEGQSMACDQMKCTCTSLDTSEKESMIIIGMSYHFEDLRKNDIDGVVVHHCPN